MNPTPEKKRVPIVGGVAGGASCAARLRRLDEHAEIHLFEGGPHISFANCGLPYHVGNVIADESALLVADAELFRSRFRMHVPELTEVMAIDRVQNEIEVRDLRSGAALRSHPRPARRHRRGRSNEDQRSKYLRGGRCRRGARLGQWITLVDSTGRPC